MRAHLKTCDTCRDAYDKYRREQGLSASARTARVDATLSLASGDGTGSSPATRAARHFPKIEGYKIVGIVGQGGMGIVYQAVQKKLNRTVALKVLPAIVGSASPSAVTRFRREATAAARLHHTNIIPIYDFGESRDAYYYAMELISGKPLQIVIHRLGEENASTATSTRLATIVRDITSGFEPGDKLPQEESVLVDSGGVSSASTSGRAAYYRQVARWISDAAEALHHAHGQGIIHRDIKPANIILSHDGRIMIADFGLAKNRDDESVTMTGSLLGTMRYLSPEQAMARRVHLDHRTDVYSLGATMYELLAFQPAFPGSDEKEILGAIITRDPTPPRKIVSSVPPELETICLKAMEKSADARYATAHAFAEDLRRYTHDLPIAAKRPGLARRAFKFLRRRKAVTVTIVAGVLLAFALTWVQWERNKGEAAMSSADRAKAGELVQLAISLVQDAKWDEAERLLGGAIKIDPGNLRPFQAKAWLYLMQYNSQGFSADEALLIEAEELCQKVLAIDPDDVQSLNMRGVLLKKLRRYDEAIAMYRQVLEKDPGFPESWSNLGALYATQGDFAEAEHHLRKGVELAEPETADFVSAAWRHLGTFLLYKKDPECVQHIETAVRRNRVDPVARLVRARMYLTFEGHQNVEAAVYDAWSALELQNPPTAKLNRMLALARLRSGRFEEAVVRANEAIKGRDMPTCNHLIAAIALAKTGDYAAARIRVHEADAAWPETLREQGVQFSDRNGVLWFETQAELAALRAEVAVLLDAAPSTP